MSADTYSFEVAITDGWRREAMELRSELNRTRTLLESAHDSEARYRNQLDAERVEHQRTRHALDVAEARAALAEAKTANLAHGISVVQEQIKSERRRHADEVSLYQRLLRTQGAEVEVR
jgi:predicted  nucleic acid-binding Zn-ribbon protein